MSATRKRGLRIDDSLGPAAARHDNHHDASTAGDRGSLGDSRLRDIPLDQIRANPDQPRKRFEKIALASLVESIRARGVLQPVIVRPVDGGYDTLDGAGSLELALIENVVREDLSPIEQARTIAVLLDDLRVTGTVLAKRLGRSRADIANTVRLLDLPDEAIELIDSGELTKGHGKALLAEPDHDRRRSLARRAAEAAWSVRQLEAEIASAAKPMQRRHPPHPDHCAAAARLQDALVNATGCEVRATPTKTDSGSSSTKPRGDGCFRSLAATPRRRDQRSTVWRVPRGTPQRPSVAPGARGRLRRAPSVLAGGRSARCRRRRPVPAANQSGLGRTAGIASQDSAAGRRRTRFPGRAVLSDESSRLPRRTLHQEWLRPADRWRALASERIRKLALTGCGGVAPSACERRPQAGQWIAPDKPQDASIERSRRGCPAIHQRLWPDPPQKYD